MDKKQSEYVQLSLLDFPLVGDWVVILPAFPESKSKLIGKVGQIIEIEVNDNPILNVPGEPWLVSVPWRMVKKHSPPNPPDESA